MKRKTSARKGGSSSKSGGPRTGGSSRSISKSEANTWLADLLKIADTLRVTSIHFRKLPWRLLDRIDTVKASDIDCPDPREGCELVQIIPGPPCWCGYVCDDGSSYFARCL